MRSGAKLIHKSSNNSGALPRIENYVGLRIESIGEQALDLETDATNNKQLSGSTILLIFVLMMSSWWGWSGLFHWLFPKIELEESTQPKIRKLILSVILSLIISLMAGGIIISIHSNLT